MMTSSPSSKQFHTVRSITSVPQNWCIKVRIVRLWTMPGKFSHQKLSSIEMVLQDQEDNHIQASVRSGFIAQHRSSLHEGKTYVISHFSVVPTTGSYRTTDHPYKVLFQYSTSVQPCLDDGKIHQFGFSFTSFSQILEPRFDDRYLVDVVGKLTGVGSRDECDVNGTKQPRVDIELMDEEMERLECTLWGQFAEDLLKFMSNATNNPIILIIQWCKVHEFAGRRRLSNSMYTSRLHLHPSVKEVDNFIHKLRSVGIDINQEPNPIAQQASIPLADDLLGHRDRRQLRDLRSGPADTLTVVLAKIVNICTDKGWSYTSFDDGTATCNMVIFDHEFSKLVGLSALQMKDRIFALHETQSADISDGLPLDVVEKIIGKQYLLKLKITPDFVKGHSNACVILRMTNDEEIINAYLAGFEDDVGSEDQETDDSLMYQGIESSLFDSEGASTSMVAPKENADDEITGDSEEVADEKDLNGKKKQKIEHSEWAAL